MKTLVHQPLHVYADQLTALLQQSAHEPNPALFLFKNEARKPLFMAEAILRLLKATEGGKKIKKQLKSVKNMEDLLGEIDCYDGFFKEFSRKKGVLPAECEAIRIKRDKAMRKLNKRLTKKQFDHKVINRLSANKADFDDVQLISAFEEQMHRELKDSASFFGQFPNQFTDLESQVHEIRRKLRWISIYAESLMGVVALKSGKSTCAWQKEFLTEQSLASPFNRLPRQKGLAKYILLDARAFYALNFTVDRLGVIKDKALSIEVLAAAIKGQEVKECSACEDEAREKLKLTSTKDDLFADAHHLLNRFFHTYKIHKKLF